MVSHINTVKNANAKNPSCVKKIYIGDWNMQTEGTKSVPHGVDFNSIVSVETIIRNDSNDEKYCLSGDVVNNMDARIEHIDPTYVVLSRKSGGQFHNANFSKTDFNRGIITITHSM